MAVTDKYQPLIDKANQLGISSLNTREENGVLHVSGVAPSAEAKQQLWNAYGQIDPDYRSGDLVLDISAPEGSAAASASGGSSTTYTVQSGDTLSKIGQRYGVGWQKIFEANRDKLDDPDKIFPGQELKIPQG
ncbi:MAG TPA: LysM peptidoglycan-binding domain-containing protein [Pyrinomonadaceae bacterium]|nr:LysM peptidoglycan-binding domain-containing protein [Pyrinomonadaceae bacterium]